MAALKPGDTLPTSYLDNFPDWNRRRWVSPVPVMAANDGCSSLLRQPDKQLPPLNTFPF